MDTTVQPEGMKADIRRTVSKTRDTIFVIYLVVFFALFVIGFFYPGLQYKQYDNPYSKYIIYKSYDTYVKFSQFYGWYGIFRLWGAMYFYTIETDAFYTSSSWVSYGNIILLSLLFIALFVLPLILWLINNKQAKTKQLSVTDSYVIGARSGSSQIQLPIENIDNVSVTCNLWDKIRTGKTIIIKSNTKVLKYHCVQNAEEVVAFVTERINSIKATEQSQPAMNTAEATSDTSITDKMKELVSLKEAGLITEEEFEQKRADLLKKIS